MLLAVQDSGRSPDTSMFPATTEFAPAMPEAVPEPAAPVEHMTYNSAYETYQETPMEQATPNRRASSPSPRCAQHSIKAHNRRSSWLIRRHGRAAGLPLARDACVVLGCKLSISCGNHVQAYLQWSVPIL